MAHCRARWRKIRSAAPAAPDAQVGGIVGWLLTKQSEFYREISSTIRAAKADGSAVWTLVTISFAYGIFHAAGPGHGKAVISSYLVANEETARRGIVLSFVSALMQSLIAVLIVGIGAWLLNATAKTMCGAERVIEIASYTLIAAFGVRLVWSKGGGLIRALRSSFGRSAPLLAPALGHAAALQHDHGHRWHDHRDHGHHHHDHAPGHAIADHDQRPDTRTRSTTNPAMSMTRIADIPTVRSSRNFPVAAAGDAASAPS